MAKKKKEELQEEDVSTIIECPLEKAIHNAMMPYSEHVILDRTIPRIEDGLKPVQRRIIYAMATLGLTPEKPFVKSAKVVGDCLGKYHPHGDTSVYEAMVRLAQPFNVREVLIDGQGNYGSIDGDPAAAMRYTETRLAPLAMELIKDMDKDTIPMVLNFDDTTQEPVVFPGKFPNLFVNGAIGIAVGMSTAIPPHNLGEMIDGIVAYIDNPEITLDEIMKYIPGPDFPTGGIILANDEIRKMYDTSIGKIKNRANAEIIKEGDREHILITEIPYQTKKADLLEGIQKLREEKKELYGGISEIIDESNRKGVKIIIKIRKEASAMKILAGLYKTKQLEKNYNARITAIVDGKPEDLTLLKYISKYVEIQREIIYKRSQYDLNKAIERAHILEGLLKAVSNIRRVVDIVLESNSYDESKAKLKEEFELTEKQAVAVLDVPLKRLNKLDVSKMQKDLDELNKKIKSLNSILSSKKKQLNIVKDEILEIKAKYATPRQTKIIQEKDNKIEAKEIIEAQKVSGYLLLSYNGTLRFVSDKTYKTTSKNIVNCAYHELAKTTLRVDSDTLVLAFTKKGNAVVFTPSMVLDEKWKSKGTHIAKIGKKIDSDDSIIEIVLEKDIGNKDIYFATKDGMIKRTNAVEYPIEKQATYPAIVLKDDDELLSVQVVDETKEYILFVTELGQALNAYADIPEQGRRASGVKGIKLQDNDKLKYCVQNNQEGEIVVVLANGFSKRVILSTIDPKNRYSKGVTIAEVSKIKDIAYVSLVTKPYDFAIFFVDGELVALSTEDISIENRTSKGKNILKKVAKAKYEAIIYAVSSHNLI